MVILSLQKGIDIVYIVYGPKCMRTVIPQTALISKRKVTGRNRDCCQPLVPKNFNCWGWHSNHLLVLASWVAFSEMPEVCSLLNSKGTVIICWPFGEGCADKLCKFERCWNNPQVFLFKDCSPLNLSWSLHQNWWPQLFLRSVWVPRIPGIQTLSASLWLDLDGFQNGGAVGTPGLLCGVGDTGARKMVRRSIGIPSQFCSASFQIF